MNQLTSGGAPLYRVMTASWLTLANAHAVHVLGATAAIAWLYWKTATPTTPVSPVVSRKRRLY